MNLNRNIAWEMLGRSSKIWTEIKEQLEEDHLV